MRPASVTSLKTYLTCPKKYYYAYIEWLPKEDDKPSIRLSVSNILHAALTAYHARATKDWNLLDLALVETWDPRLFSDLCTSANEYHRSRWILWQAWSAISSGETVRYGQNAELDFGGGKFRSRIDRIDQEPDGISFVEYHLGDRVSEIDQWSFQIYASISAKLMKQPVKSVRVIQLGAEEPELKLNPEDPFKLENDIKRLRRVIDSDQRHMPHPDQHCRFCAYSNICDAAESVLGSGRIKQSNELFRIFRALEILIEAGESIDTLKTLALKAVNQIHFEAKLIWIDGREVGPELLDAAKKKIEIEGGIVEEETKLTLHEGDSLIVPVSDVGFIVFPKAVSRTSAEIFGRSLRIAWERTNNYIAATTDGLTGLARREIFEDKINRLSGQDYTLIICDIDRFKLINDTYGHEGGDVCLKIFADIVRNERGVVSYRIGGEEFLLFIPSKDLDYCRRKAEEIRKNIAEREIIYDGKKIQMTTSFGIASGENFVSAREILKRADAALYRAKEKGRNCVEVF
ncbi:MAG: hypothetical protein COS94_07605 [Candidatus Hydrogenedentes bacterium CG07_land_8_20_14_0_80_42_17]|nr:MAG: hypothetical protein COS94_07605 [Candidatus Hydrogenedentes bacterium CG07_land_8_20_14_0_80_42_17]